jgi:hypothetical protein
LILINYSIKLFNNGINIYLIVRKIFIDQEGE